MWTNQEMKEIGKRSFKANYWSAVFVAFLLTIVSIRFNFKTEELNSGVIRFASTLTVFSTLIKIFVANPLSVGGCDFFFQNLYSSVKIDQILNGFRTDYLNVVKIMFFRDLFTFLWTLLFIIPGIVKGYEYMMIPYLLAEDPHMPMEEAFATSKAMMNGNKLPAFWLHFSFIGWIFLGALTMGILFFFYVTPYMESTSAALYDRLKFLYNRPAMDPYGDPGNF